MKAERYALFKNLPDGPLWAGFEDDLEEAKKKITALSRAEDVECFVYDIATHTIVASAQQTPDREPES